ncbi:hypothetical protein J437_LFUL000781 [Ladona fulva]|uniref:Uncharacterized protein n=1 Tax=Ladona fulva TaxID=123851 RepID=A0A8K0PAA9_LADFU|nr:hypothetical protein J437_LFUL000781 [Ladona fulva]
MAREVKRSAYNLKENKSEEALKSRKELKKSYNKLLKSSKMTSNDSKILNSDNVSKTAWNIIHKSNSTSDPNSIKLINNEKDDTNFLVSDSTNEAMYAKSKSTLSSMIEWYYGNNLKLNANKTVLIEFTSSRKPRSESLLLKIESHSIQQVEDNKFLGLNIDAQLNWYNHIDQLCNKMSTICFMLKSAIRCHGTPDWVDILPAVLLGLRAAWKDDLQSTSAELVYGEPIRLPGEFLFPASDPAIPKAATFVNQLRESIGRIGPRPVARHGYRNTFVYKDLATCTHVFVRNDAVRAPLVRPYDGPFLVLERTPKFFKLRLGHGDKNVSIDRLKHAFIISDESHPEDYLQMQALPTRTDDQRFIPEENSQTYIIPARRNEHRRRSTTSGEPAADSAASGTNHSFWTSSPRCAVLGVAHSTFDDRQLADSLLSAGAAKCAQTFDSHEAKSKSYLELLLQNLFKYGEVQYLRKNIFQERWYYDFIEGVLKSAS